MVKSLFDAHIPFHYQKLVVGIVYRHTGKQFALISTDLKTAFKKNFIGFGVYNGKCAAFTL